MPMNDDAQRRTARERSQSRVSRYSGSSSRTSTDSYGRARQDAAHLSQTRYARQARQANRATGDEQYERRGASSSQRRNANGQASRQRRDQETTRSRRSSDTTRASRGSRYADSDRSARYAEAGRRTRSADSDRRTRSTDSDRGARYAGSGRGERRQTGRAAQSSRRQQQRSANRQPSRSLSTGIAGVLEKLPSFAIPAAIAIVGIIIVLVLIFAVLVPSCSSTTDTSQQATVETTSSQNASAESQSAEAQGLASIVSQAKSGAQTAAETTGQVSSLEASNSNVETLVSLLGEDDAAKLISQAKTNPEALWIAAHPDEYAFDGIEVQYKILKLAADEPAAISYVRQFPAKYPMNDASTDKELAMDVASPSDNVPTTSVPHLYQWDRRWAYTVYSSATFGLTGCGPTSLAMVYQGLNRTVDMTPHDMAVMAEERGYMSEYNGTDSAFLTDTAGELGMNCWEIYPAGDNIRDELSNGHVIIANLGAGYFTTNGHFFVLAGLTDDGQVIINDPYSVERSSQTWDADFIAGESIAMWSYSKA